MPDTETVELRTDSIEQLINLLQTDLDLADFPRARREAIAVRLRQELDEPVQQEQQVQI